MHIYIIVIHRNYKLCRYLFLFQLERKLIKTAEVQRN